MEGSLMECVWKIKMHFLLLIHTTRPYEQLFRRPQKISSLSVKNSSTLPPPTPTIATTNHEEQEILKQLGEAAKTQRAAFCYGGTVPIIDLNQAENHFETLPIDAPPLSPSYDCTLG